LETIKCLTLAAWDEEKKEPPLQIAVTDNIGNNPFSIAFLRGHHDVAKAVLEVAQAQFEPKEQENARFVMDRPDGDSDGYNSEDDGSVDSEDEPAVYRQIIGGQFTIENIGEVSMQVKSRVKPTELLRRTCQTFALENIEDVEVNNGQSVYGFVIEHNDMKGLKLLLAMESHFQSTQKLDHDEDQSRNFSLPDDVFQTAVAKGRTELLAEMIRQTGAGLPLAELVKRSGVELKEKPRYYQGLTVYGQKRKDWANAGRQVVKRSTGSQTSPLIQAAKTGALESVEWFLSKAPLRCYQEFAKSKAAREDSRLKHLSQAPGGFDRAISRWLGNQNDLVLHVAVLGDNKAKALKVAEFLIDEFPEHLKTKAQGGYTPLALAVLLGRMDITRLLLEAGADPTSKTSSWQNILHVALRFNPWAAQLYSFLDLLSPDIRTKFCQERSSLDSEGRTPLHTWLVANLGQDNSKGSYPRAEEFIAVLKMLIASSDTTELRMLDASGDTPLHAAIARCAHPDILKVLIEAAPAVLYRENAVGRTPAELARDAYVSSRITEPPRWRSRRAQGIAATLMAKPLEQFATGPEESAEDERSWTEMTWDLVRGYVEAEAGTQAKRRLVSLNEANDVAKRIGDRHQGTRYGVKATVTAPGKTGEEDEWAVKKGAKDVVMECFDYSLQNRAWIPKPNHRGRRAPPADSDGSSASGSTTDGLEGEEES
jgi:hypothetical protein